MRAIENLSLFIARMAGSYDNYGPVQKNVIPEIAQRLSGNSQLLVGTNPPTNSTKP